MISEQERSQIQARVRPMLEAAGVRLRRDEWERLEVTDLGLGNFARNGLTLHVYVNTERVCAKELVLLPDQTCPEHRHPPVDGEPGKEETFRVRWGKVHLFVEGPATEQPQAKPPEEDRAYYSAWREIVLNEGDQFTILPDTRHWFRAGPLGAVVTEFSTRSRDEADIFTDPRIRRME